MMMAANNKPYDAEIEYLESTGTQHINFSLIVNVGQSLSIEGQMMTVSTNITKILGIFSVNPYLQFDATYYKKSNNIRTFASHVGTIPTNGGFGNGCVDGVMGNFVLSTSGRTVANSGDYGELSRPLTQNINGFRLFKSYENSTGFPIAFGYLQIKVDNIIKYDLIPVRVGQVGYMYDKVSHQLFGNSGTGNFILGPDK
jgi:hypothetical protein